LFGLEARADSGSALAAGLYSPEATEKTYRRLLEQARLPLVSGFPVIVDAAFGSDAQRRPFRALADELDVPIVLLACEADDDCLEERIRVRDTSKADASEADLEVLEYQKRTFDPLDRYERERSMRVDTRSLDGDDTLTTLIERLKTKIRETTTERS
jgi:predicted kinase